MKGFQSSKREVKENNNLISYPCLPRDLNRSSEGLRHKNCNLLHRDSDLIETPHSW